jgi:hypothetical protein
MSGAVAPVPTELTVQWEVVAVTEVSHGKCDIPMESSVGKRFRGYGSLV